MSKIVQQSNFITIELRLLENFMLFIHEHYCRTNPSQGLELNSGNDIIPEYLKSKAKQSFKKHPQTELLHFLVHERVYADVYADVYNFADNSLIRSLLFLI